MIYNWEDSSLNIYPNSAATVYFPDGHDGKVLFLVTTSVSHSETGVKRIFINISKSDNGINVSTCNIADSNKVVVAYINKQGIKMFMICHKAGDDDYYYQQLTPFTKSGEQFVKQSLMESSDTVSFDFNEVHTELSAIGFSKVWSEFGGDAL